MNLKKAKKNLEKLFKSLGLDFDFDENFDSNGNDRLKATNSITIENYDDDITVIIEYYPSGLCDVRFVFDQLDKSHESFALLNAFNNGVYGLKAYVRGDGFLEISSEAENVYDDQIADFVNTAFNNILNKSIEKYLVPISRRTV